jgi:hypothetical protein
MTPPQARDILRTCEQDRVDMSKPDKTAWTSAQWDEHLSRLERIEAAEARARKCLDEAARAGG